MADERRQSGRQAPKKPAKVIKYVRPDLSKMKGKAVIRLAQSDILTSNIQIIKEGGDNNLHAHAGMDGFWFVIQGRARFYGTTDEVIIAELGPREGVFIPRNYAYWFEKVGDEDLEILQVEAIDRSVRNERIDYKALKDSAVGASIFNMEGKLLSHGYEREPGSE